MVNIDPRMSQAVWARVGCDHCGSNHSLPEILEDFFKSATQSLAVYRQIHRIARGTLVRPAQLLLHMTQNQVHRLEARYFLTTGTTLPRQPLPPADVGCLTLTLQQQYQASVLARENYLSAAQFHPKLATFFTSLAGDQAKIQGILTRLVASRL